MPFSFLLPHLPPRAAEILLKYDATELYEIRLRADRPMTVTTSEGNLPTGITLTGEEIAETVVRLCGGSLHAYAESMKEGFLSLPNGCRVGLCGSLSGGEVTAVTSLCLRIPRSIKGVGAALCRRLLETPMTGMLLYSPPGEGKTTLLTNIEFKILRLFFTHPGVALDRKEILKEAWDDPYVSDEKIVDVNMRRLRIKVEKDPSNPKHIITVWGLGYRWDE